MSKELKCERCGLYLGETEKGKQRKGSVLLCERCWERAKIAMDVADMAARQSETLTKDMPDFLKDLLDKDKYKG